MSDNFKGGCGLVVLVLALIIAVGSCSGSHTSNGGKSGNNPYTPGTTNYERYERLYNGN